MSLLRDLKAKLEAKKSEESALSAQIESARKIVRRCDDALVGMGSKKKGKSPEVVNQIQSEIDKLRAEKAPAKVEYERLYKQRSQLTSEIRELEEKVSRIETLNAQQVERDRAANQQNNNTGRTPNRQRKIGWF
jgi:chromosome segregation ATPase